MFEVYKPSGRFGFSTFIYFLIGLVVTALLAVVYAYGLRYIPFIYISVLMTGAFGVALGFLGSLVVDMGHCRSVLLAMLIGLVLCVFGLAAKHYVQYGLWVGDVADNEIAYAIREGDIPKGQSESDREAIRKGFREAIAAQVSYFGHFEERAKEGMVIGRRGNGAPMAGFFMYSIWVIELVIVLFFAWVMPVGSAKEPYSEKLGLWADETEEAMRLPVSSDEMVEQIKSATTVEQLLEIPIPKSIDSQRYVLYSVHSVPGEEMEDAYLSVSLFVRSYDKDGEEKLDETELVKTAILTADQRGQLLENASLMNEALEDYRNALAEDAMAEDDEMDDGEV